MFATSAIPTSAMSLNGSVEYMVLTTFGSSQKTDRDPYVLVYWTGASTSTPFSMNLYTSSPSDPSLFLRRTSIAFKSKTSISLDISAVHSLSLGAIPDFVKKGDKANITGTWEIARGGLKTPVDSEKTE